MSESRRMAAEVSRLSPRLAKIVECAGCGVGIAVDAVAERYGYERHDWRCPRPDCAVSKYGPSATQERAIAALVSELPPPNGGPSPSGPAVPDARLPREHDDSERLPF